MKSVRLKKAAAKAGRKAAVKKAVRPAPKKKVIARLAKARIRKVLARTKSGKNTLDAALRSAIANTLLDPGAAIKVRILGSGLAFRLGGKSNYPSAKPGLAVLPGKPSSRLPGTSDFPSPKKAARLPGKSHFPTLDDGAARLGGKSHYPTSDDDDE